MWRTNYWWVSSMLPWKELELMMYMGGQGCYNKTPMIKEPSLSIKIAKTKCNRGYNKHTVIIWFCIWGTYLLWYLEGGCLFLSWETRMCETKLLCFFEKDKKTRIWTYPPWILPHKNYQLGNHHKIWRQDHLFKGTLLLCGHNSQ